MDSIETNTERKRESYARKAELSIWQSFIIEISHGSKFYSFGFHRSLKREHAQHSPCEPPFLNTRIPSFWTITRLSKSQTAALIWVTYAKEGA